MIVATRATLFRMGLFDRLRKRKTSDDSERPGLGLPSPDDDWTPSEFVEAVKLMTVDHRPVGTESRERPLLPGRQILRIRPDYRGGGSMD